MTLEEWVIGYPKGPRRPNAPPCRTADDFWARTEQQQSGCLAWTGPYNLEGYGSVWMGARGHAAHRVAWTFARGPIPAGVWVLHRCDNRRCVNPDHLYLGTRADNGIDLAARWAAGEVSKATRVNPWEPSRRLNGGI
jgi:hypothetical protein